MIIMNFYKDLGGSPQETIRSQKTMFICFQETTNDMHFTIEFAFKLMYLR